MATTREQIDLWRASATEHERLEFKEAKNQYDFQKLREYCVGLANEGGGTLLLGIKNDPPREVVGTAAMGNPTGMAMKLFESIGFRIEIEAVEHPGGRVVVCHIPSRPRGTAYHVDGKYLYEVALRAPAPRGAGPSTPAQPVGLRSDGQGSGEDGAGLTDLDEGLDLMPIFRTAGTSRRCSGGCSRTGPCERRRRSAARPPPRSAEAIPNPGTGRCRRIPTGSRRRPCSKRCRS